jgi:hypothetical protein
MAWKKTVTLGRQAIPNFARTATLVPAARCFVQGDGTNLMPGVGTVYDVACLAFFRRLGVKTTALPADDVPIISNQPLAVSFWSNNSLSGASHRLGMDHTRIPAGAEWYSVAWFAPPTGTQTNSPTPDNFPAWEDVFKVVWGLSI